MSDFLQPPRDASNGDSFIMGFIFCLVFCTFLFLIISIFAVVPNVENDVQAEWVEAAKSHNAGKYILDENDNRVFKWNDELEVE